MISRAVYKNRQGRRLLTSLAILAVISGTLVVGSAVLASTPAGQFELEGNALSASGSDGAAPDDWDRVCYEQAIKDGLSTGAASALCTATNPTHGATAVAWTTDTHGAVGPLGACTGNNCTIFTGGGSKDPIDINQWAWKDNTGGLPDKDNLLHGFAARYSIPSSTTCPGTGGDTTGATTCEMLYFGNDRYDNSGDAQQGFWFFQNKIGLGTNSVGGGSGFTSSGVTEFHRLGDVLLISDFSNGGTTSTITAYTWDPGCLKTDIPKSGPIAAVSCGDANLRFQASSTTANCAAPDNVDPAVTGFCGIVDPADGTVSPWSFVDKTTVGGAHPANTYLQGEFYEGGVNLSSLNLGGECFASIASETRSSQSTTAVLKDFVLGDFGDCDAHFSTTASPHTATQIPANGLLAVSDSASLTVSGTSTWSGKIDFYLCGPGATTCDSSGTHIGSSIDVNQSTTFPLSSTATTVSSVGTYCWAGVFTSNTNGVPNKSDASTNECFSVTPRTPSLSTTATGPVAIGSPVSDTAHLGNTANKPGSPVIGGSAGALAGGTITFRLYGPSATDVCTAANLVYTSSAVPVTGNNDYGSGNFTPTSAGTYRWIATYSGDSPNTSGPVSGTCGESGESVVINPKLPTIVTNAVAGPLPLGSAVSDTATIGNTANKPDGNPAGGTVTFKAYGPSATASCTTGNLVFTSAAIPVSGNGTYGSGNFTPTLAGTYWWIATYTGDSPNTSGPVSTSCGDANESSVIISLQPSMTTAQRFTPNDSATVTVASGAGNLAGNVRFQLFVNSATCANTVAYDSGNIDITTGTGTGLSRTVSTSNSTAYATTGTTFSWLVTYTSSNAGHTNVTATCNAENSSITIANGGTFSTP